MTAILLSLAQFATTVVNYALGGLLIVLGLFGTVVVCQWLLAARFADRRGSRLVSILRKGSGSLALVAVLVVGLVCLFALLALQNLNR